MSVSEQLMLIIVFMGKKRDILVSDYIYLFYLFPGTFAGKTTRTLEQLGKRNTITDKLMTNEVRHRALIIIGVDYMAILVG